MKNLIFAILSLVFVFLVIPSDASAQDTKQNLSSLKKAKIDTVQVPAFLSLNVLQGTSLLGTPSVSTPEVFKTSEKQDLPKGLSGDDERFAWPFPPTSQWCCFKRTCACQNEATTKTSVTASSI